MPSSLPSRPHVSANFATTWDGRISTRKRTPSDFSSPRDKERFLEIRALADAVFVSAKTAAADGMTIGLPKAELRAERIARGQVPYPIRVLLTNTGRIPADLAVFRESFSPILIFSTTRMPTEVRAQLAPRAEIFLYREKAVNLQHMLLTLHTDYGVDRAHCEGGGALLKSFLAEDLVDELYLTLCPRIFGSTTAPTITGAPDEFLPRSLAWTLREMKIEGEECFVRYGRCRS